ncbi:MAG: DUF362 domain-containing protein [Candidatus Latescibacterota bacterium]
MDRRDFLKKSLITGGIYLTGQSLSSLQPGRGNALAGTAASRVVICRDELLRTSQGAVQSDRMLSMLDRAMLALYDKDDPVGVWREVVSPGETVGLKVNCLAGRGNSTTIELVDAVCDRLQQAGIAGENIVIWDRLNQDLESAGYRIAREGRGVRCIGNDVLGYERELAVYGSVASLLCRTLTRVCDCVINLSVLKDHGIAGVTVSLKNMFGAIHNPNKYHLTVGDPYIADVNMLPGIRRKVRLHICDASTVQYEGGPSYLPHWTWSYDGLIVSRDPVALDQTGWRLIERKRAEEGMQSLAQLNRQPSYIHTAADAKHRLGTDDPTMMDVVET